MPAAVRYLFDDIEVDTRARRVTRGGHPIQLPDRHFDVLHELVSRAGTVISKDELVHAGWGDVAVTDNSLEQAISGLRRALGRDMAGGAYIETVPRRGYRFTAAVARSAVRESDDALDALLAPHRAWLEGRAALLTLERERILHARDVFEGVLRSAPGSALAHIGLANACVMQFETTRADAAPDAAALHKALEHAREACRLEAESAEAWATLGFVLDRCGQHEDGAAAVRRAVTLEPDNWRHHFRLSFVSWGEERLRSARRTLALLPSFPLAHWLAATVHVARNVLDQAEVELDAGIAAQDRQGDGVPFSAVGLHWLRGLIHLARGDAGRALADFERELACESTGHLYARECCANTWYAIGALHVRQSRLADARLAFGRAVERVAAHPLARLALAALDETGGASRRSTRATGGVSGPGAGDAAIVQAAALVLEGNSVAAAQLVERGLAAAPPGSAAWVLPVEPLLHVASHPDTWAAALARLRARAS